MFRVNNSFFVTFFLLFISITVNAAISKEPSNEMLGSSVDNYSTVYAMSEMARTVIETVDGKFHVITIGMGFIALLIAFFGFKQYDMIRNIAITESKKVTNPIKDEYDALIKDIGEAKKEHAKIIENLSRVEIDIQNRANNLIHLQIANICLSDPNLSDRAKRQGTEFLKQVIESTNHSAENNYILSTAYTMYSYILRRENGEGTSAAFDLLKEAVSKGIEGYGIYYNMACYCDKKDSKEMKEYLDKAIKFDPTTLFNAMEDDDLKDYVAKIYNLKNSSYKKSHDV